MTTKTTRESLGVGSQLSYALLTIPAKYREPLERLINSMLPSDEAFSRRLQTLLDGGLSFVYDGSRMLKSPVVLASHTAFRPLENQVVLRELSFLTDERGGDNELLFHMLARVLKLQLQFVEDYTNSGLRDDEVVSKEFYNVVLKNYHHYFSKLLDTLACFKQGGEIHPAALSNIAKKFRGVDTGKLLASLRPLNKDEFHISQRRMGGDFNESPWWFKEAMFLTGAFYPKRKTNDGVFEVTFDLVRIQSLFNQTKVVRDQELPAETTAMIDTLFNRKLVKNDLSLWLERTKEEREVLDFLHYFQMRVLGLVWDGSCSSKLDECVDRAGSLCFEDFLICEHSLSQSLPPQSMMKVHAACAELSSDGLNPCTVIEPDELKAVCTPREEKQLNSSKPTRVTAFGSGFLFGMCDTIIARTLEQLEITAWKKNCVEHVLHSALYVVLGGSVEDICLIKLAHAAFNYAVDYLNLENILGFSLNIPVQVASGFIFSHLERDRLLTVSGVVGHVAGNRAGHYAYNRAGFFVVNRARDLFNDYVLPWVPGFAHPHNE